MAEKNEMQWGSVTQKDLFAEVSHLQSQNKKLREALKEFIDWFDIHDGIHNAYSFRLSPRAVEVVVEALKESE